MALSQEALLLRQIVETQLAENVGERRARVQLVVEEERIKEMIGQRPALIFLAAPLNQMSVAVDEDSFQKAIRETGTVLSDSGYGFRPTAQGEASAERWREYPDDPHPARWRLDYYFDGFVGGYVTLQLRDDIGYYSSYNTRHIRAFADLLDVVRHYPGESVAPFLVRACLFSVGRLVFNQPDLLSGPGTHEVFGETWLPQEVLLPNGDCDALKRRLITATYRAFGIRKVPEDLLEPGE